MLLAVVESVCISWGTSLVVILTCREWPGSMVALVGKISLTEARNWVSPL
jgi:hypothetical protein